MTEVNWSYETLAEAEVFRLADEAADRKRGAPIQPQGVEAIHNLFRHRCCGYQVPPKAEDVVRGMKKETWSDREHRAIVSMFRESLPEELVFAWERGAYTLRDLVSALHKTCQLHNISAHTDFHCAKYRSFWPKQRVAQIHCQ